MDAQLASGDIDVSTGDLVLISGTEAIAQQIGIRLQFFKGEWFLDTRLGVPYFQSILGARPNANLIRAIYREAILETPGVLECNDLDIEYDGGTRRLTVSFSARVDGSDTPLDYTQEFIIGGPF